MTHFLKDLIEDLKEHRLWPIAIGLALAVIAVPVVLSKPAKNSSATTASTGTTGASLTGYALPELKPAVSVSSAAASTERKSVIRLARKNPFEPLVKPKAPSTGGGDGAATSDGGSATGAGAGTGSGTSGGAPTSTGGDGSTGSTGSGSAGVTYFAYVAKVKFGELGQTKSLTLQQLRSLPSSDNPVVVFMGATLDAEKAVFLVSTDADLKGDGSCKPSTEQCVFLYMGAGDSQTLEVAGSDGSLKTYELKLTSIETKVLDKAPGASSSRSTGRAKAGSTKHAKRVKHATKRQRRQARIANRRQARVANRRETRLAKRARQAQAGRYFNAFGRVGF